MHNIRTEDMPLKNHSWNVCASKIQTTDFDINNNKKRSIGAFVNSIETNKFGDAIFIARRNKPDFIRIEWNVNGKRALG